ncbi:MAG: hypothetical protein CM1200mP2_04970 [Planctomycetaceae bacterium]|nr:MAG: hypothetical protein CM1200mP2_04970 [Planctomycetaceae bacterium]
MAPPGPRTVSDHASDRPLVDTARWSQLIAFRLMRAGGVEALQLIYATLVVGCALLTVSPALGIPAPPKNPRSDLWSLGLPGRRLAAVADHPSSAGRTGLLRGVVGPAARPQAIDRRVIVVGIVMGLWANLHGSFVIGWLLLGSHAVGRAADRFRRPRPLALLEKRSGFAHRLRKGRRRVVGAVGGHPLRSRPPPLSIWQIGRHPNLADIIEWQPLQWHQSQARAMFAGIVLVVCGAMSGRRRVRFSNWLMLVASVWPRCRVHE